MESSGSGTVIIPVNCAPAQWSIDALVDLKKKKVGVGLKRNAI